MSNKKLSVAVIADRTAYGVRYTGKLSNWFHLQVDERLARTIRFNESSLWTHPNSIRSSVISQSSRSSTIG